MNIDPQTLEVKNNTQASRFEVQLGDKVGIIDYHKHNQVYSFTHTGVPSEFEGQGIANRLPHDALEMVKAEGGKVIPACPFTKAYVKRHPEYQSMVATDDER